MVNWWIDGEESELVQAVKDAGFPVYNSRYACWERADSHYLQGIPLQFNYPTITQGSIQFNDFTRRLNSYVGINIDLYPEVNVRNYDCTSYYPRYGHELLNSHYTMLPYGDLLRRKEWLFQVFGEDNCIFVRPNSGLKEFTGQVVKCELYEKDIENISFYDVIPELLVIVSVPKLISWEARVVVVNGNVITGSYYRINRLHQEALLEQRHLNSTQDLINRIKWQPDEIYVIDVCETNGELKVVEVGAFNYAGLYRCDRTKIVEKISNFVIDLHNKEYQNEKERRQF